MKAISLSEAVEVLEHRRSHVLQLMKNYKTICEIDYGRYDDATNDLFDVFIEHFNMFAQLTKHTYEEHMEHFESSEERDKSNMNGVNMYLRNEEAKNKFKMIFNKDADNYRFSGVEHINLVSEYGLHLGDLKKSIDMITTHLNVQEAFAKSGHILDDGQVLDIILNAIR